jgi:hypothetical protein
MLGRLDPYEMLAEMDGDLFAGWMTFWAEEPFGPQVENMMRARIAACAAMNGDEDLFLPITASVDHGDDDG